MSVSNLVPLWFASQMRNEGILGVLVLQVVALNGITVLFLRR